MKKSSHLDEKGKARMVDVGAKKVTRRKAEASALIKMRPEVIEAIRKNTLAKGDVLNTARLAGILAAKKVHELIPLTHQLALDSVSVAFEFEKNGIRIKTEILVHAKTGAEMEALTAASVAALTIYDMAKSMDRGMEITDLRLERKSGGKSGTWKRKGTRAQK
jgi:cyclic pyranopterin phosphate synthase